MMPIALGDIPVVACCGRQRLPRLPLQVPQVLLRRSQHLLKPSGSRASSLSRPAGCSHIETTNLPVATRTTNPWPGRSDSAQIVARRRAGRPPLTPWFVQLYFTVSAPTPTELCEHLASHGVCLRRSLPFKTCPEGEVFGAVSQACPRESLAKALGALWSATGCMWDAIRVLEE